MVDTDREIDEMSVKLEDAVEVGEELVMLITGLLVDEAALLSTPLILIVTVVVTETLELVEAVPVAGTLSEDKDTVREGGTETEVSEVLVKCV